MKNYNDQESKYLERKKNYKKISEKQERSINIISSIRLLVFVSGISFSVALFFMQEYIYSISIVTITLFLFLFLVIKHEGLKKKNEFICHLINVNQVSLDRLSGSWVDFPDTGEEYINEKHPYSIDLDIFGKGSVFQWINTTNTYLGREKLKKTLTNPLNNIKKIRARQKAIIELSKKLDWRQHFQVESILNIEKLRNPSNLLKWSEDINSLIDKKYIVAIIRTLPIITIISLIAFFLNLIPISVFLILILINIIINFLSYGKINRAFEVTSVFKNRIATYQRLLKKIEEEEFESKYLSDMKFTLINARRNLASVQINELKELVDRMDLRYNALFHFIINSLFLWDYQNIISLNKWKRSSGKLLRNWLNIIAEFEELSSLALVKFDNPEWAMPQLLEKPFVFSSQNLGHPLLHKNERICNNIRFEGAGNILIITGSNMSGKSTLLRTVGINLILAYSGAPVCAQSMECSIMDIYSSMRVNDNLEKSISSFYAELLKIKMIIEAAKKEKPMLFLIDEIFRGTNSKDRHIGAKNVIKNLSRESVMGLVSTHDLELGNLEKVKGLQINNYHFKESYTDDGEMKFNYKLYPGVSTSSNAIYLMKMIGIDVD
ncbi:MAG: MutS-related protein [bacterium]